MTGPAISVLTPTYNRAHVLHRAYESLQRQTVRDFEWVVVDDGSTDGTPALLARWQAEADFPITWYCYSDNRGKSAAVNVGVNLVSGDYTLILDSDDALLDDAMETIAYWRRESEIDDIITTYAMIFRCVDDYENPVGKLFFGGKKPGQKAIRMSVREARYRYGMTYEVITVAKTEISRQRHFVELTKSEYCPESITHNRVSMNYDTIYIDHAIRQYFQNDGVSRISGKQVSGLRWPRGNYLRALAVLNNDIDYLVDSPAVFLNAARKVARLGLHVGRPLRRQFRDLVPAAPGCCGRWQCPAASSDMPGTAFAGGRLPRLTPTYLLGVRRLLRKMQRSTIRPIELIDRNPATTERAVHQMKTLVLTLKRLLLCNTL